MKKIAVVIGIIVSVITIFTSIACFSYWLGALETKVGHNVESDIELKSDVSVINERTYEMDNKLTRALTILEQANREYCEKKQTAERRVR